jgi:hypothetical protein
MKVIKYSQFKLTESINSGEYTRLVEGLEAHYNDMVSKGNTTEEINEGIWDLIKSLGSTLSDGFTDRMKNYAASWLLQKMGLPDNNEFFTEFAKNVVEQIQFTKIGNYFGEGSCKYWVQAISDGLKETLEERLIDILARGLGLDINMNGGILGTAAATVRETATNYLNSTEFSQQINRKIEGVVCGEGTSFSDIFGGGKFTEKDIAKAAKSETPGMETNTGMGGGIMSLLGLN